MKVPYVDLGAQWDSIKEEALPEISRVLSNGKSIGDPIIEVLECALAKYLNVKHCVTLNSGTDALLIGLKVSGIGRGDEVITVANSFIASTAAIAHVGAKPVFVDVGNDHLMDVNLIEMAITSRTKAIMPVHLEGKMCNMRAINEIAKKYNLTIIEDAAQSFGSKYSDKHPGYYSELACFSFHPLKNLNGIGDGGFIATNNSSIAERTAQLRNHGQIDRNTVSEFGFVSRLDSIQAIVLSTRLKYVDKVIEKRREIAQIYSTHLKSEQIVSPVFNTETFHSYHLYVIEVDNRAQVVQNLEEVGIQTKIHYPTLICDQPAYISRFGNCEMNLINTRKQSQRILSIPIHQNLNRSQIEHVIEFLLKFTT